MATKFSDGLRNGVLATSPFKTLMALGFIKIYAGTEPATANDALGAATLLCTVSNASTATGITFEDTAVGGVISKKSTETWSGVNAATGTAAFYRLVAPGDTGGASTTEPRVQGPVVLGGPGLQVASLSFTSGLTTPVGHYTVTFPTY